MLFLNHTVPLEPKTPPLDCATTAPALTPSWKPSSTSSSEDTASWELLTTSSALPNSGHTTPVAPVTLDECSSFDTETFPAESYLFPSERNGTWCTETVGALQRPSETAVSLHRHASELDWSTCRNRLQDLVDSVSEGVNARLNQAFEGRDVAEMGNRIMGLIPSLSTPSMRHLGQSIDSFGDSALSSAKRCWSETNFLDKELQGDQWSFARIMSTKARKALVRQKICREWQVLPSRTTLPWQDQLNSALAVAFTREKQFYDIKALFSMVPVWSTDIAKKTWRLELDTGLTNIVVDPETDGFTEQSIYLAVGFELPEGHGSIVLADVERGVIGSDGDWMIVVE